MLPQNFIERMKKDLGDEAEAFLGAYFALPKKALRINNLKVNAEKEAILTKGMQAVPWEKHGFYYMERDMFAEDMDEVPKEEAWRIAPGKSSLHSAGAYYIQEPSAMAPVSMLDIRPGMCVLDLCAAPGGKTTQIASKMEGKGLLIANEPVPERAKILSQNIERLGIRNAMVVSHDPSALEKTFPATFDRILVDAPCSGEGMFRKDRTAVEEWSEETVKKCAARQEKILDAAVAMLKPGGRLVYSTCTFAKEEDEGQIARILAKYPGLHIPFMSPFAGIKAGDIEGTFRIWPQDGLGEGHFMAVVERDGASDIAGLGYVGPKQKSLSNKEKQQASSYFAFVDELIHNSMLKKELISPERLFLFKNNICFLPENGIPDLEGLKVLRAGIELGEIRKDRFIPSHAFALVLGQDDVIRHYDMEIDGEETRNYLNGQSFQLKDPTLQDGGWCLMTCAGISLGWAKIADGILKNHYPKGLRINYQ
ncbi:MAG: RsmF rRNA methyltransferase first C-terminal domain-containing protein [Lachnospiraceae bacterium]|nr:RsmF rRNA methyltransferase first C-terminal domain-containing protein [Lachnospiraceae bacterium]